MLLCKSIFKQRIQRNYYSLLFNKKQTYITQTIINNSINNSINKHIIILGGGISGLTCAYYLKKLVPNIKISLIEQQNRVGGWIQTKQLENGAIIELGPRSLRPKGNSALDCLELIHELKLTNEMINVKKDEAAAKNRFIYFDNQLHKLPTNLFSLFFNNSPILKGIFFELLKEPFQLKNLNKDESIDQFIRRRLGNKLADILIPSIIHGIYAGDTTKLSLQSTLPFLYELELNYGSITFGLLKTFFKKDKNYEFKLNLLKQKDEQLFNLIQNSNMYSFKNGMETLPKSILNSLTNQQNFNLILNKTCENIQINQNLSKVEIQLNDGQQLIADELILALPSKLSYNLIKDNELNELIYNNSTSVAVVNMLINKKMDLPINGFGYLVPKNNDLNNNNIIMKHILGVVFDTCPFPSHYPNQIGFTAMIGGTKWEKQENNSINLSDPTQLKLLAQESLKPLNLNLLPDNYYINYHSNCIPQYLVGHNQRMKILDLKIQKKFNNQLKLVGASYTGVSINDCISNAKKLVERMINNWKLDSNHQKIVTGLEMFRD